MTPADTKIHLQLNLDQALSSGNAISGDKLGRLEFAKSVVAALANVTRSSGFVLSVEGAWGSGKTSTLAMVEELLSQQSDDEKPVIVHFNPWLIGDREALLRQFLGKLANQLKLSDHSKDGKKAAKEVKTYAKAFDVIKLVPGAEPWASMIKSVLESVSDATNSVAEYKTPDIEQKKAAVQTALQKFPTRIIVFIDDIDRLFPLEVFEMIRIIKAVGNLPNIGYVLAWDPAYVSSALQSASVPQSSSYLDKIVQTRMPLPRLSSSAKEILITEALDQLPTEALAEHFPNQEKRIGELYRSGLGKLIEQPRDVIRIFNTVQTIEPALRGEITIADIIGLASLMIMAPKVFELLCKHPQWFVGPMRGDSLHLNLPGKADELIAEGNKLRDEACGESTNPLAVRGTIHFLFPSVAKSEGGISLTRTSSLHGHISARDRLLIALQLSTSPREVSFVRARKYLLIPDSRTSITESLTAENCSEFLESLGELAQQLPEDSISDTEMLCLDIARMLDSQAYVERAQKRSEILNLSRYQAIQAIEKLCKSESEKANIAEKIVSDPAALTVAAHILSSSYLLDADSEKTGLTCPANSKESLLTKFSANVRDAALSGLLFSTSEPSVILWRLSQFSPQACPEVFAAARRYDPTLDTLLLQLLSHSFDSTKGQTYAIGDQKETIAAYCPMETLTELANHRLADATLTYPVKAAWRALTENREIYGIDGSYARR